MGNLSLISSEFTLFVIGKRSNSLAKPSSFFPSKRTIWSSFKGHSVFLKRVHVSSFNQFANAFARAFIQPETWALFSPEYTGFCCHACTCNENNSGFSIIVNRRTSSVAKDTWELKCEKINSLKTLKVKSGKADFFKLSIAATVGKNKKANSSQIIWNSNTKFKKPTSSKLLWTQREV